MAQALGPVEPIAALRALQGPFDALITCGQSEVPTGELLERWTFAWASEARRLLRPGAHIVHACPEAEQHHRITVGLEDAGFEIRDCVAWTSPDGVMPIVLARNPLATPKTAENLVEHGVGALNVEACRYGDERRWPTNVIAVGSGESYFPVFDGGSTAFRWLASLVVRPGAAILDPFGTDSIGQALSADYDLTLIPSPQWLQPPLDVDLTQPVDPYIRSVERSSRSSRTGVAKARGVSVASGGRCAGCGEEGPLRTIERHVIQCPEYLRLWQQDRALALDPVAALVQQRAEEALA